jgi:hypothetical protein
MAHGQAEEMARAEAILGSLKPSRLDVHGGAKAAKPVEQLASAAS